MKHKSITLDDLPKSLVALMEGPKPPREFESDGCSNSPDSIGASDLRPACHFHDWAYRCGGTELQRLRKDQAFYRNLLRCGSGRIIANLYYFRVRLWGVPHYRYCPARMRPRGWQRVAIVFKRYVEW